MSILPLKGTVQHYDWGGNEFIPRWLNASNPERRPWAEYWMGSHPKGESSLWLNSRQVLLKDWLAEAPAERLGADVVEQFGPQLPYLFKILDVRQMLSIQCHPNREQAQAGFAREEAAGIPRNAPHRNYRDPNPKSELMVALSPFWLLHGFQDETTSFRSLQNHVVLDELAARFREQGLRRFYKYWMNLPQVRIDKWLSPLAETLGPLWKSGELSKDQPDYWAAKALSQFRPAEGHFDRGVLSVYLMNLVKLAPGQGIFQAAGILHAYLEGQNVELMANSDNVFRGGLTRKHIDIPELLKTLKFEPLMPQRLIGRKGPQGEVLFELPVPEFALGHIELSPGQEYEWRSQALEILLLLEGEVTEVETQKTYSSGNAFVLPAGKIGSLRAQKPTRLFRAYCPIES